MLWFRIEPKTNQQLSSQFTMAEFIAESLQNKSDCDLILDFIDAEKEDLTYDQVTINYESKGESEDARQLEADFVAATADFETQDLIYSRMEEGPAKSKQFTKRMRAEVKVRTLNERKAAAGALAVFKSGYNESANAQKLVWLDEQKAAVAARKAALPA